MTPREKAIKLVNDFWEQITYKLGEDTSKERAKKCALICVSELIINGVWKDLDYWIEVEQEIEKL